MKKNGLRRSDVVFNADEHTYKLGDTYLQGITGLLSKHLFPDKYTNVPEHVLEAAKEKGTRIHDEIEMFLNGFEIADPMPETVSFMMIPKSFIESEYLVSDNANFATKIDLVGDDLSLYDIKTTYEVDEDYCAWQLSICAELFELQNPDLKVKNLAVIWLKDGAEVIPVERIPSENIKKLLDCEINGTLYRDTLTELVLAEKELKKLADIEGEIIRYESELKKAKAESDKLKTGLLGAMKKANINKYEGKGITLTVRAGYTRSSIDSARLKEEKPEIYGAYLKESKVKESLTIKLKN